MAGTVSLHVWLFAVADVAAGALAAFGLRLVLRRLSRRAERARWRLNSLILTLLRTVLPWGAALAGVWSGILILPLTRGWRTDTDHALLAAAVLIATLGLARMTAEAVRAGALSHAGTSGSATIFVNIGRVLVLIIGLMVMLDSLGIAITPLLTALGVGGLAVALALQDTLTNLFAGVNILASGKVQPGDYILLGQGQEGYVVDTNWRNTTIRQLPDNVLIVPNATVATSVITNYSRPRQDMSVLVRVGVAFDSDLEHVERVTCEVAREVMETVEGGVAGHEPAVRYSAFGDYSVDFSVILRTSEVTAQYLVVHEFIKRLHRRYQQEGIKIPFPELAITSARAPGRAAADRIAPRSRPAPGAATPAGPPPPRSPAPAPVTAPPGSPS